MHDVCGEDHGCMMLHSVMCACTSFKMWNFSQVAVAALCPAAVSHDVM